MNESRIYGMISIGKKAGLISAGTFSVDKSIKNGAAVLVILAENASDNTKKSFTNSCSYYDVKHICFGTKEQLGRFTGNKERVVISINDYGIAKSIMKHAEADETVQNSTERP